MRPEQGMGEWLPGPGDHRHHDRGGEHRPLVRLEAVFGRPERAFFLFRRLRQRKERLDRRLLRDGALELVVEEVDLVHLARVGIAGGRDVDPGVGGVVPVQEANRLFQRPHPNPPSNQQVYEVVRSYGYPLEAIPYEEWVERVVKVTAMI